MCPGNCKRSLAAVTPIIVASFVHRTVNFDRKSRRLCKYVQGDEEEKEDEEEEEEYPKEDCESRRRWRISLCSGRLIKFFTESR